MYKIYADKKLIYDSTVDLYKIAKGSVTLETGKSGSASISIYPDHPYYDKFVRMKTVIKITKSDKIIFRGRILDDTTDYWNNKVLTCEGELGFLQDSLIRPFSFTGTPEELFKALIEEHNSQVDEFKQFKIGVVTVADPNDYISRENSSYESALTNMNSRLIEDSLGGYFYITHGEEGKDDIPTINYVADFDKVSPQKIEFGSNLKNYTKTVKASDIATVIVPLGAEIDDGKETDVKPRLTITKVNDGKDYVESTEGVALFGRIVKAVQWDDVTDASNLKKKAEEYVEVSSQQSITIEVTAIDLHLLDKSIDSMSVNEYIQVTSAPHNFDMTLLCTKQTIDLLKPDNDTLTLGHSYSSFTEMNSKTASTMSKVTKISNTMTNIGNRLTGKVSKTGDTMSGNIVMGGNKVTDLGDPESDTDAVTVKYLNDFSFTMKTLEATKTNIEPDIFWTFGEVDSLDLTLVSSADNKTHEYCFEFTPSANFKGLNITPAISWVTTPRYETGKVHQVSILRGVGVMICA